jgi:WD40 repeat protein
MILTSNMKTNRVMWRLGLILAGLVLAAHALLTAGPRLVRTRTIGRPVPSTEQRFPCARWALVYSVTWSPDGKHLAASGSPGYGARIWNSTTGVQECVLIGHKGPVRSVTWSPDGTRVASAADDGIIRVWSSVTGQQLRRLGAPMPAEDWSYLYSHVSWSPDGAWIAAPQLRSGVVVWDASSGRKVLCISHYAYSVAWSPDSQRLALANGQVVRVWDVIRGRELRRLDHPQVSDLAWSPTGDRIASASNLGKVRVWEMATGRMLWDREYEGLPSADAMTSVLSITPASITNIAWSPTGRLLATTGADGAVCLWNAVRGMQKLFLRGQSGMGETVAWSPDGRHVAAGGMDGRLWVWDLAL